MIKKYKTKPVTKEAVQFDGTRKNGLNIMSWAGPSNKVELRYADLRSNEEFNLAIRTNQGEMIATKGDFIIKGVAGECYPCKPEIFAKTYEEVGV